MNEYIHTHINMTFHGSLGKSIPHSSTCLRTTLLSCNEKCSTGSCMRHEGAHVLPKSGILLFTIEVDNFQYNRIFECKPLQAPTLLRCIIVKSLLPQLQSMLLLDQRSNLRCSIITALPFVLPLNSLCKRCEDE